MNPDFWHRRWSKNQIPFHEGAVNRNLPTWWRTLEASPDETVLVPLCGKAHDLAWLNQQGHRVVGVELSPIACRDFFSEHAITPQIHQDARFTRYRADGIELWCGDIFDLSPGDLPDLSLIYDRAALIALPSALRRRYATHLNRLCPVGTRTLLITLDYPPQEFDGPPFAVADDEVETLFGQEHTVERLLHEPLPERDPLSSRGFAEGWESVFRLTRR